MPSIKTFALIGSIAVAGVAIGKYMERRKLNIISGQVDSLIAENPHLF